MEKIKIGFNAGQIWDALNESGKLSMFELCRKLNLTFEDVAISIGWLARERKILVDKQNNMLYISLH